MKLKKIVAAAAAACAILAGGAAPAAAYEPTQDFPTFWSQLRQAFLDADPEAINAMSYGGFMTFRYDFVTIDDPCKREAAKAYLTALLDSPAGRTKTWGEFLERTPTLDLENDRAVYVNAGGEYSVHLKVRFQVDREDGAWRIFDMLNDIDGFYKLSERAGGPSSCG